MMLLLSFFQVVSMLDCHTLMMIARFSNMGMTAAAETA
jgi:hypothetical protein